jgi:hypothetical protein
MDKHLPGSDTGVIGNARTESMEKHCVDGTNSLLFEGFVSGKLDICGRGLTRQFNGDGHWQCRLMLVRRNNNLLLCSNFAKCFNSLCLEFSIGSTVRNDKLLSRQKILTSIANDGQK